MRKLPFVPSSGYKDLLLPKSISCSSSILQTNPTTTASENILSCNLNLSTDQSSIIISGLHSAHVILNVCYLKLKAWIIALIHQLLMD